MIPAEERQAIIRKYTGIKSNHDGFFFNRDLLLHQTLTDAVVYGFGGYILGIGASIFFKNKGFIRNFGLGFGLSSGTYKYILPFIEERN